MLNRWRHVQERFKAEITRLIVVVATVMAASETHAAAADDFCAHVRAVADQVHTGKLTEPPQLAGATTCQSAVEPEGVSWFCYWTHGLREDAARAAFNRLKDGIDACGGNAVASKNTTRVNHPDSYDTGQFILNETFVSVALKDKAALRSTLIFLRISPLPHD